MSVLAYPVFLSNEWKLEPQSRAWQGVSLLFRNAAVIACAIGVLAISPAALGIAAGCWVAASAIQAVNGRLVRQETYTSPLRPGPTGWQGWGQKIFTALRHFDASPAVNLR